MDECYILPGLDSMPLNCLLKTKKVITRDLSVKQSWCLLKRQSLPLSFTTHTPTHTQNYSSSLRSTPKKKHKLKCYATVFTFPLYNGISLSSEVSLNMENKVIQLHFNTCLYDNHKYKYVHKVWLERNELIFISHKKKKSVTI